MALQYILSNCSLCFNLNYIFWTLRMNLQLNFYSIQKQKHKTDDIGSNRKMCEKQKNQNNKTKMLFLFP